VPPRKPSPVGAHVPVTGGLVNGSLVYAREVGAGAIQVFVSNPRAWRPVPGDPAVDAAFGETCARARMPVFVHATYLVNFASPSEQTCRNSAMSVSAAVTRGRRIGARGVVFHAGSAVDRGHRDTAIKQAREWLLPLLDGLGDDDPDLLVEPTAGGGQPLAATVDDLGPFFAAFDNHPRLGVCADTCHLFAAGHNLAAPGGVRAVLTQLVKAVGRGRLKLIHANDAKDELGSRRDRHAPIGAGRIGTEPFAELFRHPTTRGVPVIVETPGNAEGHARDIALLKNLRDR
jgi:deoxyribonuclease-4